MDMVFSIVSSLIDEVACSLYMLTFNQQAILRGVVEIFVRKITRNAQQLVA